MCDVLLVLEVSQRKHFFFSLFFFCVLIASLVFTGFCRFLQVFWFSKFWAGGKQTVGTHTIFKEKK